MGRRPYIVAVDFDGTLISGTWSKDVQKPVPELFYKLRKFKEAGAMLVLWTCREGEPLIEAIALSAEHGVIFDAVNENVPPIAQWNEEHGVDFAARKVFADLYVDDRSPGSIDHFMAMDEIGIFDDGFFTEDWEEHNNGRTRSSSEGTEREVCSVGDRCSGFAE